jgi:hypothetical protein
MLTWSLICFAYFYSASVACQGAPTDETLNVVSSWTPDWPEPKPTVRILTSSSNPGVAIGELKWNWGAKGTVATRATVYECGKPSKLIVDHYPLGGPQCRVGSVRKSSGSQRIMFPIPLKKVSQIQVVLQSEGVKLTSPPLATQLLAQIKPKQIGALSTNVESSSTPMVVSLPYRAQGIVPGVHPKTILAALYDRICEVDISGAIREVAKVSTEGVLAGQDGKGRLVYQVGGWVNDLIGFGKDGKNPLGDKYGASLMCLENGELKPFGAVPSEHRVLVFGDMDLAMDGHTTFFRNHSQTERWTVTKKDLWRWRDSIVVEPRGRTIFSIGGKPKEPWLLTVPISSEAKPTKLALKTAKGNRVEDLFTYPGLVYGSASSLLFWTDVTRLPARDLANVPEVDLLTNLRFDPEDAIMKIAVSQCDIGTGRVNFLAILTVPNTWHNATINHVFSICRVPGTHTIAAVYGGMVVFIPGT